MRRVEDQVREKDWVGTFVDEEAAWRGCVSESFRPRGAWG